MMRWGALTLLAGLVVVSVAGHAADPSALWNIVNGQCVPHEKSASDPSPCTEVTIDDGVAKGYALLKDRNGIAQFLLIPTTRLSGIDDAMLLAAGTPNYWEAAWRSHYFVEERLQTTLPRDGFALAVNSAMGRTQNQLHIHIDCIRRDVRDTLAAELSAVTKVWTPFPEPLAGHQYRVIRLNTLDGNDPFRVLAKSDQGVPLAQHTLVLVPERFNDGTDGFVLLDDHANLAAGDRAFGEELEDHSCAIAPKS